MRSFATQSALLAAVSCAAVTFAACNQETVGSSSGSGAAATTSTSTSSGGSTTGGSGGTTASTTGGAGAGGTTTSSGGGGTGGTGGTTTSTTASTGGACGDFAQHYGSSAAADEDQVAGAVVDSSGGVIIAGELGGKMTVGATTLMSAGGQDAFVVGLSAGGGVAWTRRIGSTYDDRVKGIAALPGGGAVLVGTFDGQVDFGGKTLTSIAGPDAFMLRLDASGALVSVLQIEDADLRAVAVTEAGDIVIAGDFTGKLVLGAFSLTTAKNDMFVAKIAENGMVLAVEQFSFDAKPGVIALGTGAGRTYVAGSFSGTVDFGKGPLVSAGSKDVYLARLDDTLAAAYSLRFGDNTAQEARAVAVLSDGSAVMTGSFKGKLDLGGTMLVADTEEDVFVARVDDSGNAVLGLRFGDAAAQQARAIAVGANDEIFVGGGFHGTMNAGDGPVTSAAGEDAFLVRFDALGMAAKTMRWGGAVDQRVLSVSVDPCGAVVLGGTFNGSLPIGADAFDATGGLDAFVARISLK